MKPITPTPPGTFEMFVNAQSAWLYLAAALVITNMFTLFLLQRRADRRCARRVNRQPRMIRHAALVEPWRGEIARTMALPVVSEAFPALYLAEGW
jgi:hypothetical protein